MKPFSPLYFIKENLARCIALMLMIFLSYGVYLGGLYVTNPLDNWSLPFQYNETFLVAGPASFDENFSQYTAFRQEMENHPDIIVLEQGSGQSLNWTTIMGFESGSFSLTFRSVEDFKTYCEYYDIDCDFSKLRDGSLILSDRFAKNLSLDLGDIVDKNYAARIYDTFTLDALTTEAGYTQYYICEEPVACPNLLLLANGIDSEEFSRIVTTARDRNLVSLESNVKETITNQFQFFNIIYTFVVLLLSVILAVTINAAFVGMYQRRNFEFAVYRAIGISKKRIVGKIVGELLWMDLITLFFGGILFFLGLYLFNHLVLYPAGNYLQYIHPTAVIGLVLCNATVLVPLIVTRCRQLLKADVCEY